jgi:hypothetical protein
MNRAARHSDVAKFAQDAGHELETFLIAPDDTRLDGAPLLKRASAWWLDGLTRKMRHCFVCGAWLANRNYVGAVLLATATTSKPSCAVSGVCCACWKDADAAKIEHAAAAVLNVVLQ